MLAVMILKEVGPDKETHIRTKSCSEEEAIADAKSICMAVVGEPRPPSHYPCYFYFISDSMESLAATVLWYIATKAKFIAYVEKHGKYLNDLL